jgi:pimeloyl-ACP methyl ester carboxylesterase
VNGSRVAATSAERSELSGPLARWRYADEGRRDVRLDLIRGYAVFAMICDHVAGISWITPFTGANRFVASAAEGFVFLAGLLVGMVYGRKAVRDGLQAAAEALLHRATVLYGATVGLTLLFVALFQFTNLKLWLDRAYGLGLTDPVEVVIGTLTLHYTYHGTDILWLYVILIAFSPILIALLLLNRWWAVLLASWLLWLAYQRFPSQATIPWVATNVNYFPVAAWQLLFVNGMVLGFYRRKVADLLGRVPLGAWLAVFSVLLGVLILIQRGHDTGRLAGWPLIGRLAGELYVDIFDKPTVAYGRLVAFTILAGFMYALVTQFWVPIRRALGWLLLPLGMNSLLAYGIHLVVIVLVYNIEPLARLYDRSRTGNTILQVVTVGLTLGAVLAWRRLERGIAWRPPIPDVQLPVAYRRVAVGIAVVLLASTAAVYSGVVGPVQVERQATQGEALAEAGILRYVPPDVAPGETVPILLALHGEGQTGPQFAGQFMDLARERRWAVIAPTFSYGDWSDPEQVAGDAVQIMPVLEDLVTTFDDRSGVPTDQRVLVLGEGRGGRTARQFALFHPDLVHAVATVGPAPCTLPVQENAETADAPALPFPFGVEDLDQYVGQGPDPVEMADTRFWLGVSPSLDEAGGGCPWGAMAGRDPLARAQAFAGVLGRIGTPVAVVTLDGPDARSQLTSQAVAFLRQADPRASR